MASLVEDRTFTKPRALKRVIPTNIGIESFEEGDYCFRVSNFDDYVYFSLTEFDNGVETPMDLTTFGDIFLKFISGGSAILKQSSFLFFVGWHSPHSTDDELPCS